MKQILIDRYGPPEEVARCAEVPDVGAPAAGEVVFDVLLFPINPADVSFCRGTYRLKPPLPATPGAECVGRVTAVGAGVSDVKPGDLVINLQRENWAQQRRVKADDVVVVPAGLHRRQAVMSRSALIGGGQTLAGFILGRGLATRPLAQIRAIYADLGEQIVKGVLSAPVEAVYPIDEIKAALAHAQREGRSGKILVASNAA